MNSKVTLKVLEAGNEYFSVSRTEKLEREKSRKRKWEKKSQALMNPESLSEREESLKGYLKNHKENEQERATNKKKKEILGTGLKNISNFCHGNSVIQALLSFRDIIGMFFHPES